MEYPYYAPNGYEEDLNQQVIGHLHYSLQTDATLLNEMLAETAVSFADGASIVAHQDDPLPHTSETEIDREIDWVIRDDHRLVGFESKYGDTLTAAQLRDELRKLRANADEREVHLIAVTHHADAPSVLDEFDDEPVHWLNWISLVKRLHRVNADEIRPEQRVSLQMLRDLFEVEDMEPFTGFDHRDKEQYRYFVRDLRPELETLNLENRGRLHNWIQEKSSPAGYTRIVPKYLEVPFFHESRPTLNENGRPRGKRASKFTVVVDLEEHTVHAGIVFQTNRYDSHRQMLQDHRDTVVEHCHEQDFELWIGRNSINHRSVPPQKTDDPDQMREWLSPTGDAVLPKGDDDYVRALFLRDCTQGSPQATFEAIRDALAVQKRRFLERDDLLEASTLVTLETVD